MEKTTANLRLDTKINKWLIANYGSRGRGRILSLLARKEMLRQMRKAKLDVNKVQPQCYYTVKIQRT